MDNKQADNKMCHGDCIKCSFQQRVYCASYMARNNYAMIESVLAKLDSMQSEIENMNIRINSIQSNEAELIKPFMEEDKKKSKFEDIGTM